MTRVAKSTGLLPAAIAAGIKHVELPSGGQGLTAFQGDRVVGLQTPDDPLIRVHETLHGLYSAGSKRYGRLPMTQQIMEDMRLHREKWPLLFPNGTPRLIQTKGIAQLEREAADMAKQLNDAKDLLPDARGQAIGLTCRNQIVRDQLDGMGALPRWMTDEERRVYRSILDYVREGHYRTAADILERTFFQDELNDLENVTPDQDGDPAEMDGGDEPGDDDYDGPNVVTMDDQGPFTEQCGDPMESMMPAMSGSRLFKPALRKQTLPARLFLKRTPVEPGGATIIDASGSMDLSTDEIVAIINASPHATLALYSGDNRRGTIYVAARDGFRRPTEAIVEYLDNRAGGNTIDLEAVEWLLKQNGPRVMVTDREFCGSAYTQAALLLLANAERSGDIEVVTDGRTLIPNDPANRNNME